MRAERSTYRDGRRHGWFLTYKSATEQIRQHFGADGCEFKISTALAVYVTILELANDRRGDEVTITKKQLAEQAGISAKAAWQYQDALAECGVIRIERHRDERGLNLPNTVHILDTETGGSVPEEPTGSVRHEPTLGSSGTEGSVPHDPPYKEEQQQGEEERHISLEGQKKKSHNVPTPKSKTELERVDQPERRATYYGKRVPPDVVVAAERALRTFNEVADRRLGAWRASGQPSEQLRQIIGQMLDRPHVTDGEWDAAIRNTIANPPSWLNGRPIDLGDVFGPKAVESALVNPGVPLPSVTRNGNGHRTGGWTAREMHELGRQRAQQETKALR